MIYLDSWVWLELGLAQAHEDAAREAIDRARERGGVVSAIALTEVEYVLSRELDRESADRLSSAIDELESVHVVPVSAEIASLAATVRSKYYDRGSCELSYADAIHVATATLLGCAELHTGDSDFEGVEEVDAVVHR